MSLISPFNKIRRFWFNEITGDCTIVVMGPYREAIQQYREEIIQYPEHHLVDLTFDSDPEMVLDTLRRYVQEQQSSDYADRHVSIIIENITQSQFNSIDNELYVIFRDRKRFRMSVVITAVNLLEKMESLIVNVDYFVTWPKNRSLNELRKLHVWFHMWIFDFEDFKSCVDSLPDLDIALVTTKNALKWYRIVSLVEPLESKENNIYLHEKRNC